MERLLQRMMKCMLPGDVHNEIEHLTDAIFLGKSQKHIFANLFTRKRKDCAKGLKMGELDGELTCYILSK